MRAYRWILFVGLVIAILFLAKYGEKPVVDDSLILSSSQPSGSPGPLKKQADVGNIRSIQLDDSSELRKLLVGDEFRMATESGLDGKIPLLKVFEVMETADFRQIISKGYNGSSAIITLNNSLTKVYVKTSSAIYEYSGSDFRGVVKKMGDLNLSEAIIFAEPEELDLPPDIMTQKLLDK